MDQLHIKQILIDWYADLPLYLFFGQQKWTDDFNTNWSELWKRAYSFMKLFKSGIVSFLWRLLNRSLLIARITRNSLYPCCKGANISLEHIFLFCPTTARIIYPNSLTEVLTPLYNITPETIITMWAQWKTFN